MNILHVTQNVIVLLYGMWIGGIVTTLYNRLPNNIKIGPGKKPKCNHCENEISFIYFFPIIGYFLSMGKCRFCKKKIPIEYLLIEIVITICILMLYVKRMSIDNRFLSNSLLVAYLNMIFFIYLKHKKIIKDILWGLLLLIIFDIWQSGYEFDGIDFISTVFGAYLGIYMLIHKFKISHENISIYLLYISISYSIGYLFAMLLLFLSLFIIVCYEFMGFFKRYINTINHRHNISSGLIFGILIVKILHLLFFQGIILKIPY
jgi:leader peptidase (prepilin peptidase)/N-methyltransferase